MTKKKLFCAVWDSNMPFAVKKLVLERLGFRLWFTPAVAGPNGYYKPAQVHGGFHEMFSDDVYRSPEVLAERARQLPQPQEQVKGKDCCFHSSIGLGCYGHEQVKPMDSDLAEAADKFFRESLDKDL